VIFGLSFCDQTAYSVPSNPNIFPNLTSLASFYDNNTKSQFANFEKAIQQVPCETTPSAQFSLVRTCDDCTAAYKNWLCSVTIPRCTDFSAPDSFWWLQKRNMIQPYPNGTLLPQADIDFANTTAYLSGSRNPSIDTIVQPGPYKEVLPCEDTCYNIVQSCPSAFGFACPQPGDASFNFSYGILPQPQKFSEQLHQVTCNYPGASKDIFVSRGSRIERSSVVAIVALAATSLMCL
jgi:calcium channel MID1